MASSTLSAFSYTTLALSEGLSLGTCLGKTCPDAVALAFSKNPCFDKNYKDSCMSQYSPWETIPIVTKPILSSMVCLHSSAIGRNTGVLVTLITVTLGTMTDQFRPKFQPQ